MSTLQDEDVRFWIRVDDSVRYVVWPEVQGSYDVLGLFERRRDDRNDWFSIEPVHGVQLPAREIIKLAVKVIGSKLAEIRTPELWVPIELLRGSHEHFGPSWDRMHAAIERQRPLKPPPLPVERRRRFVAERSSVQRGGVTLERRGDVFVFSQRVFGTDTWIELLADVLRDELTRQLLPKYHVDFLPERSMPATVARPAEGAADVARGAADLSTVLTLLIGLAASLERLSRQGPTPRDVQALAETIPLAVEELSGAGITPAPVGAQCGDEASWAYGLLAELEAVIGEMRAHSVAIPPNVDLVEQVLPLTRSVFAQMGLTAARIPFLSDPDAECDPERERAAGPPPPLPRAGDAEIVTAIGRVTDRLGDVVTVLEQLSALVPPVRALREELTALGTLLSRRPPT